MKSNKKMYFKSIKYMYNYKINDLWYSTILKELYVITEYRMYSYIALIQYCLMYNVLFIVWRYCIA